MKVFVTGATGVIGRRLIPLLRRAVPQMTTVARSRAGRDWLTMNGAVPISLDLFDAPAVRRAVAGHDVVINLATHIPDPSRMFLPWAWRENDRLRRVASANLAEACVAAGVSRLVQESFAPAYPDLGRALIDESTPLAPVRYNNTILDAENAVGRFARGGRAGVVLRFGSFYGPDALQTRELIRWIKKGWAPLPGPPGAYISSVSHDDAAAAVVAALAVRPGVYNVVDDRPVTHREYVSSLADALHVPPPKLPPSWLTPLFGSLGELVSRSVRVSNRKLRHASGWTPTHPSVREGWQAMLTVPTVGADSGFRRTVSASSGWF